MTIKQDYAIGKTRTGDQLHLCSIWTYEDGRRSGGLNAFCNNHKHLRLVSTFKGEKATIRMRPGLFCRKCFGADEALILAREYENATVEAAQ
jgi:hypothetical protein